MTAFFILAGIIILIILGKFIFNTKSINDTESNRLKFMQNNKKTTNQNDQYNELDDIIIEDTDKQTIVDLNSEEFAKTSTKESDLNEEFMTENPELKKIIDSNSESELNNFLDENPDLLESMLGRLANVDEPAESYRERAIEKMVYDENYQGAIELINQGLKIRDLKTEPLLYQLRSDCEVELTNYKDALLDMDKAIELILNVPEKSNWIPDFFEKRSEIKIKLNDTIGAERDIELATKYKLNLKNKSKDNQS